MNPFSDLKTNEELGFSSLYDISNGNFTSLGGNMNVLNDYKNALISIKSDMLSNNNKKLSKRYFVKTNQTCNGNDLYTIIDDMTYVNSTDALNYGLLRSAYGNLQAINTDNIIGSDIIENNCVEITMIIDRDGNTEKKHVSMDDYNKLGCNAFPNKCKTYTGKSGCDDCAKNETFQNMEGIDVNEKLTYLSFAYLSALFLTFFLLFKKR